MEDDEGSAPLTNVFMHLALRYKKVAMTNLTMKLTNEKIEVTYLKNQNNISTNQTSKTSFNFSRNNCGNANNLFKVILNFHKL